MTHQPISPLVIPAPDRIEKPSPAPARLRRFPRLLTLLTILALLPACQSNPGPATPPPPTAIVAITESQPAPQATVTAETLPFDGVVDIEVSAEAEDTLASSAYSLEAMRESLRQAYSFSQDLTLLLTFDGEGRALLVPADDEATEELLIRHRDQTGAGTIPAATYEVTADGVLFLPIKGGTILMTEASKDGSKVSWGISNQPGVRGGNEIIAYRIEETEAGWVYVITHRVDSAGNWVKLPTPERLTQSQTIFAQPEAVKEYKNNVEAFEAFLNPGSLTEGIEGLRLEVLTTKNWNQVRDEAGRGLPTRLRLSDKKTVEEINTVIETLWAMFAETGAGDGTHLAINMNTGELEAFDFSVMPEKVRVVMDVALEGEKSHLDDDTIINLKLPNGQILKTNYNIGGSGASIAAVCTAVYVNPDNGEVTLYVKGFEKYLLEELKSIINYDGNSTGISNYVFKALVQGRSPNDNMIHHWGENRAIINAEMLNSSDDRLKPLLQHGYYDYDTVTPPFFAEE